MKTNYYVLIDCTSAPGKNGVTYWRLTYYGVSENDYFELTTDSTYDNWSRQQWRAFVEQECPYGIFDRVKMTDRRAASGHRIISADRAPKLHHQFSSQEEAVAFVQLAIDDLNPPKNKFQELFNGT